MKSNLPRLMELELEFHQRAFGEELARINFPPPEERRQALAELWDFAEEKGAPTGLGLDTIRHRLAASVHASACALT